MTFRSIGQLVRDQSKRLVVVSDEESNLIDEQIKADKKASQKPIKRKEAAE